MHSPSICPPNHRRSAEPAEGDQLARPQPSGLIVRQKSPLNLEYPFSSLSDWLTPTDHFFVRNHFAMPKLDGAAWKLRVDGAVDRPFEISLDELQALPSRTLTAVVECAGNGRVFYEPAREGLQWQSGAVGNAAWTGIRLADVLDRSRLAAAMRPRWF